MPKSTDFQLSNAYILAKWSYLQYIFITVRLSSAFSVNECSQKMRLKKVAIISATQNNPFSYFEEALSKEYI